MARKSRHQLAQVTACNATDVRQTVREALARLTVPVKPSRGESKLPASDIARLLDILRHPSRSGSLPWKQLPPV